MLKYIWKLLRDTQHYLLIIVLGCVTASLVPHPDQGQAESNYKAPEQYPLEAWAAVLAAIFTGWIAGYAVVQYRLSRISSERQLRAYVAPHIKKAGILRDDKTIYVIVEMKNTGQTPAFEFSDLSNLLVLPFPISHHLDFTPEPETPNNPNPTYVFYPGAVHAAVPRLPLAWEDAVKMRSVGFALYVFGRMQYLDVFGRPQWGEFCATMEPKDFWAWLPVAMAEPERQAVTATFKFTKGNNRASV